MAQGDSPTPTTGTQAEPRQISALTAVTSPATQLPGSRLVVDVPNPAYVPSSPGAIKPFLTRYLAYADLVALLQTTAPATNSQRGTPKIVLYESSATAGVPAGASTLDRLASSVLCVGTPATVLLPEPHALVLAKDPTGPLTVAVDGSFQGPTTAARWVLETEAYAVGEVAFSPLTAQYAQGARVNYRIAGQLRLFSATHLLRRVDYAGNAIPVPGSSPADWEEVSPPSGVSVSFPQIGGDPAENPALQAFVSSKAEQWQVTALAAVVQVGTGAQAGGVGGASVTDSGARSGHAGGYLNTNSGPESGSVGGGGNINSGDDCASVGGAQNRNLGNCCTSQGGLRCTNAGLYSASIGGQDCSNYGNYSTTVNCLNTHIPASSSYITCVGCVNFTVPAGVTHKLYLNGVDVTAGGGGGGFDAAAFLADLDTAASNVSASISSTTGKLVLVATL